MANDNFFGGGFSIDISNLKAGLAAANKLIRESEAEFKAAAAGMDDWSKSQEGLEKHVTSLNKMVDVQAEKVNALQREKERIISTMQAEGKSHDEIARAVDDVNGRIIKESNTLEKYKKELDKAESALDKFNNEQEEAAKAAKEAEQELEKMAAASKDNRTASERLIDTIEDQEAELERLKKQYSDVALEQGTSSKESKELAKKIRALSDELGDNKGKLADVEKHADAAAGELEDVGDAAKEAGDGFTVAKGAVADFIGSGLSSLASAAGNVISSIAGISDETKELRDNMAKLEAAAEGNGYKLSYAEAQYQRFYAVLGDDAAVTTTTSNLLASGAGMEDLNRIAYSMVGVWAKFGDSIPLDGLAEAVNHTARLGSVQGNLADALEWSGINVDDFNAQLEKCSTEQERQHLIAMTLQEQYEGLADTYYENNESVTDANLAQMEYEKTMARLGEKVEPITTTVKNGFTDILNSVLELVEGVDVEQVTETIAGGFETFIDEVIPAIKDGLQWVIDNKDTIVSGIAAIGAGFAVFKVASLINGVVDAIKAFKLANEGATVAQWLMNAAMNANPIGIIITLVAALIAGVIAFVATNDEARAKIVEMWEKVKAAFASFGEKAKEIFDNVKEYFSGLGEKAAEIWGNLKQGAADAWAGIKETFSKVASFFGDIFGKAWSKVKDIFSTGGKIFDGIKEGISSTFKNIVNRLIRGINKIVAVPFNAINSALTKIKNVEIGNFKPFQDKISTISVPEIPELAEGGILTRATHVIAGEAGAEAVLPLEKNTGWMDMLAERIAGKMPAVGNVVNQTNHFSAPHSRYENYKAKQEIKAALRLAVKGG